MSRLPLVAFVGPRSSLIEAVLAVAARAGGFSARFIDRDTLDLEDRSGAPTWVLDPGLHPVDAGGKRDFAFDLIDRVLPTLEQNTRVVLLSSNHVFSGDAALTPVAAERAPRSPYGERLADVEDRVMARGEHGLVLRRGRVLGAVDPLMVRWWNALKEGVAVIPPSQSLCAPISVETAAAALVAALEGPGSEIVQVSAPDEIAYPEIAKRMCAAMGLPDDRVLETPSGAPAADLEDPPLHVSMETSPGLLDNAPAPSDAVIRDVFQALSA